MDGRRRGRDGRERRTEYLLGERTQQEEMSGANLGVVDGWRQGVIGGWVDRWVDR